jgi:hypothetical protein
MTPAERRERARLRSERWRRAHGIGPRKPASKPWLAMGVSRSTWYRRGNRISGELSKKVKKAQGKRNDSRHKPEKLSNNWKRFPAPANNDLLYLMNQSFLLQIDDSNRTAYSVNTYYKVPDCVWDRIDSNLPVPESPPWVDRV